MNLIFSDIEGLFCKIERCDYKSVGKSTAEWSFFTPDDSERVVLRCSSTLIGHGLSWRFNVKLESFRLFNDSFQLYIQPCGVEYEIANQTGIIGRLTDWRENFSVIVVRSEENAKLTVQLKPAYLAAIVRKQCNLRLLVNKSLFAWFDGVNLNKKIPMPFLISTSKCAKDFSADASQCVLAGALSLLMLSTYLVATEPR